MITSVQSFCYQLMTGSCLHSDDPWVTINRTQVCPTTTVFSVEDSPAALKIYSRTIQESNTIAQNVRTVKVLKTGVDLRVTCGSCIVLP